MGSGGNGVMEMGSGNGARMQLADNSSENNVWWQLVSQLPDPVSTFPAASAAPLPSRRPRWRRFRHASPAPSTREGSGRIAEELRRSYPEHVRRAEQRQGGILPKEGRLLANTTWHLFPCCQGTWAEGQTPSHPVPAPRPTRPAPLKSNFLAEKNNFVTWFRWNRYRDAVYGIIPAYMFHSFSAQRLP